MISRLDALQLRLADFQGPLPLLLHLIEKNELEVTRISVTAVADQFLAVLAQAGTADLSVTGEFVAAAARLLLMKSQAILYRPGGSEPSQDLDDAEVLARQIAEYARFRQTAQFLADRLEGELFTFPRPPAAKSIVSPIGRVQVGTGAMRRAAQRLLVIASPKEQDAEPWPNIGYGPLRAQLLADVQRLRHASFETLSSTAWHPLVVVTLFLALMDAVKTRQLSMKQEHSFGPIEVAQTVGQHVHA